MLLFALRHLTFPFSDIYLVIYHANLELRLARAVNCLDTKICNLHTSLSCNQQLLVPTSPLITGLQSCFRVLHSPGDQVQDQEWHLIPGPAALVAPQAFGLGQAQAGGRGGRHAAGPPLCGPHG